MPKTTLYIDLPGFKPLPPSFVQQVVAGGTQAEVVADEKAALKRIASKTPLDILVTNGPQRSLLEAYRAQAPHGKAVLLTDMTMDHYAKELAYQEDVLLDHVIADLDCPEWLVSELRATLQKIAREEIFGIDKYLLPRTPIHSRTVVDSTSREALNTEVMKLAEHHKLGAPVAKQAFAISEELLMNAIYDAPLAQGKGVYSDLPRSTVIFLAAHEYSTLEYGCDGKTFAIAVRDPFGALTKEKFFEYIKKVLRREEGEGIIDKKKGGAGLGLYKILYGSHSLICNCTPDEQTEVIALINVNEPVRDFSKMPRSVHYFLGKLAKP